MYYDRPVSVESPRRGEHILARLRAVTLLRPGALVDGRYQILHAIARGGMGAVFEAEDTLLSRRVALKVLAAAPGRDPAHLAADDAPGTIVSRGLSFEIPI